MAWLLCLNSALLLAQPMKLITCSQFADRAGLNDLRRASVAILDGSRLSPGQSWRRGRVTVQTLWGDLAWQLRGKEGFDLVAASDQAGTSPGQDLLRQLIASAAPCVILIDELVAYVRQLVGKSGLPAGNYDTNLSFLQSLTEAVTLVPNAVLLASLPESEVEAGGADGATTLRRLSKVFGRLQAEWKPVEAEESIEIVRRRMFKPILDTHARDLVCQAYVEMYRADPSRFPSETQESRYLERLTRAYPIHPEVFDRIYGDWSTLQQFQRTRGVLKLMALVIHRLWADDNQDLLLMPANLPLGRGHARTELVTMLHQAGWEAVLDRDVEHLGAEASQLDNREPRFGAVKAALRVARTLFLGSAPAASQARPVNRGIDRARLMIGCVRPGESPSLYADALSRLSDRAHYLNASDDKAKETTRYYFDVRANLRREMKDRRPRFEAEVTGKIAEILNVATRSKSSMFPLIHVFPASHGNVRDDEELRLVVLPPEQSYSASDTTAADAALEIVRHHGARPRHKANRLLFVAADHPSVERMQDNVKTLLAWRSIVDDIGAGRLNVDQLQANGAKTALSSADAVARATVLECYRWLLCPSQADPAQSITVEAHKLNTSGGLALASEAERVCADNELVIRTWAPVHLSTLLRLYYWRPEQPAVRAKTVWEDTLTSIYLPRLRNRSTFDDVVRRAAASEDWLGTAGGQEDGRFLGLSLGSASLVVDDALLLIEPTEARRAQAAREAEEQARQAPPPHTPPQDTPTQDTAPQGTQPRGGERHTPPDAPKTNGPAPTPPTAKVITRFIGSALVNATAAEHELSKLADEIISQLVRDPKAKITLRLEIEAEFPNGVSESIRRAVTENADVLGLDVREWE